MKLDHFSDICSNIQCTIQLVCRYFVSFFQICSQVRKDIWYNHFCQKMRINSNCLSPNNCLNFMFSQAKNGNFFKYALRKTLSDSV